MNLKIIEFNTKAATELLLQVEVGRTRNKFQTLQYEIGK